MLLTMQALHCVRQSEVETGTPVAALCQPRGLNYRTSGHLSARGEVTGGGTLIAAHHRAQSSELCLAPALGLNGMGGGSKG